MNRFVNLAPTQLRLNWLKLLGKKKSIWAKSVPSVLLPTWRNVLIPQPFHRFKSVWNIQDQRFSHSSSGWFCLHYLSRTLPGCRGEDLWFSSSADDTSAGRKSQPRIRDAHMAPSLHQFRFGLFLSLRGQAALSMHSFFIINNTVHLLCIFHTAHTSKKVADVPVRQQTRLHC